jgi:DNA polymerase-4
VANQDVKSVGHEETFATDLHDHGASHRHVVRMSDAVGTRLREAGLEGRTVTVKVRFGDHTTITRSHTVSSTIDSPRAIGAVAGALLDGVDLSPGIRLLGVSVSGLVRSGSEARQLSFADTVAGGGGIPGSWEDGPGWAPGLPADERGMAESSLPAEAQGRGWEDVEAAVTAIRTRYGHASVGPATLIGGSGLGVKRRGDTQWGPSDPTDPNDESRHRREDSSQRKET